MIIKLFFLVGFWSFLTYLWVNLLPASWAAEFTAELIEIVDGDTIRVSYGSQLMRVRLQGIDAPEYNQPFGQEAKERLSVLIKGTSVLLSYSDHDRYGRLLGKIFVDGKDINLKMVEDGYAWWYRYYGNQQTSADRRIYEEAENSAKASKKGLWKNANAINPSEWRKNSRR